MIWRLFRKNLGNLREFFGQMVYRPPWQKCPPMIWAAPKLPSHENAIDLVNTFAEFFENRVQSLWDNMLEVTDSPQVSTCHSPVELLEFSPTNITELSSLLRTMAGKSCILDPVPGADWWRIVMMCCCLLLGALWTYRLLIMRPSPWNSRKPLLLRQSRKPIFDYEVNSVEAIGLFLISDLYPRQQKSGCCLFKWPSQ